MLHVRLRLVFKCSFMRMLRYRIAIKANGAIYVGSLCFVRYFPIHLSRQGIVLSFFKLGIVCRGQGFAVFEFKGEGKLDRSEIKFVCKVGSTSIPASWYKVDEASIVLAAPLMSKGPLSIRGFVGGQCVLRRTFSWEAVKWLSRLNYKTRSKRSFYIRDSYERVCSSRIFIRPTVCLRSALEGEWVVKGTIVSLSDLPGDEISVLDENGVKIARPNLLLGHSSSVCDGDNHRSKRSFTFRFKEKPGFSLCVTATGPDSYGSGFLILNEETVRVYSDICSPLFYRASAPQTYEELILKREMKAVNTESDSSLSAGPLFSIIVPLYKTPVQFLNDMVESVIGQKYPNWELILVNASPEIEELEVTLSKLSDSRIKIIELEENKGISENTNAGINASSGDYIVFFDHDDVLDPLALYLYAERLRSKPDTDALYCNEDFLNEDGNYVAPHFKSDLNIDLLRVHNYITHLLCVKSALVKGLMLRKEFDGAQDYDFLLRLVEKTQSIEHIDEVLYHWRISETSTAKSAGNKSYADEAGRKALQEHLDRLRIPGTASLTESPCFYHVDYELVSEPKVSIVIPNKDSVEVLSRCIDSVEEKTSYRNFDILIVENNSTEQNTFSYYEEVQRCYENVRVVVWDGPFNYSAINNYGVSFTDGEYLLFLNNDVEVIDSEWMTSMLGFCQREDVGIVGAKLLYPDDTVQHAGVLMIKCENAFGSGGPIHVFNNLDKDDPGYMRRASIPQDVTAVTAACMLTKRSVFEVLGGFDEDFAVAFNDVDYCLRVREKGFLVVFDADALLYHYESFSRGYETGEKMARFMREQGRLRTLWSDYYVNGDPYHSEMCIRLS